MVGTGLIGTSIGLALRARGWHVTGTDLDPERTARSLEMGAIDAIGHDPHADITFVATPVGAIAEAAQTALAGGGVVTDVGGVKAPVVADVADPRFVGGHPMAGSEQDGVEGAHAALFDGCAWVLTPTADTDPDAFNRVGAVVRSLGADVVVLPPDYHDSLVALVSHVPHLAAATLMTLAADGDDRHAAALRLAAGGFRDMTRVAAGQPGIWLDICAENRDAIVAGLDRLAAGLGAMRDRVAEGDRDGLLDVLARARMARMSLAARVSRPLDLAEVRLPVPDRPGVLADVTSLLSELGINIEDLQIVHSAEGAAGVLVLIVAESDATRASQALRRRGYLPTWSTLT